MPAPRSTPRRPRARARRSRGAPAEETVPVTAENFIRAESDLYFGNVVKDGGFGKFHHIRELTPIDHQLVIRQNRDTLYSAGVFDLDAGPVTITLPDAGERFMSMQVIDEDHYYAGGPLRGGQLHARRAKRSARATSSSAIRTLLDPTDPADLAKVHALQDAVEREAGEPRHASRCRSGTRPARRRSATRCSCSARRSPTRSRCSARRTQVDAGPAPDRLRHRLGRQPRDGGDLPERHAAEERRQDRPPAHREGRAGRRLLVDQRLRREGLLREERRWMPTRSTTSRRRRPPTARSPCSSAAATARSRTACRSRPAGTTSSGSTGRARRSSTGRGPSRRPQPVS